MSTTVWLTSLAGGLGGGISYWVNHLRTMRRLDHFHTTAGCLTTWEALNDLRWELQAFGLKHCWYNKAHLRYMQEMNFIDGMMFSMKLRDECSRIT